VVACVAGGLATGTTMAAPPAPDGLTASTVSPTGFASAPVTTSRPAAEGARLMIGLPFTLTFDALPPVELRTVW